MVKLRNRTNQVKNTEKPSSGKIGKNGLNYNNKSNPIMTKEKNPLSKLINGNMLRKFKGKFKLDKKILGTPYVKVYNNISHENDVVYFKKFTYRMRLNKLNLKVLLDDKITKQKPYVHIRRENLEKMMLRKKNCNVTAVKANVKAFAKPVKKLKKNVLVLPIRFSKRSVVLKNKTNAEVVSDNEIKKVVGVMDTVDKKIEVNDKEVEESPLQEQNKMIHSIISLKKKNSTNKTKEKLTPVLKKSIVNVEADSKVDNDNLKNDMSGFKKTDVVSSTALKKSPSKSPKRKRGRPRKNSAQQQRNPSSSKKTPRKSTPARKNLSAKFSASSESHQEENSGNETAIKKPKQIENEWLVEDFGNVSKKKNPIKSDKSTPVSRRKSFILSDSESNDVLKSSDTEKDAHNYNEMDSNIFSKKKSIKPIREDSSDDEPEKEVPQQVENIVSENEKMEVDEVDKQVYQNKEDIVRKSLLPMPASKRRKLLESMESDEESVKSPEPERDINKILERSRRPSKIKKRNSLDTSLLERKSLQSEFSENDSDDNIETNDFAAISSDEESIKCSLEENCNGKTPMEVVEENEVYGSDSGTEENDIPASNSSTKLNEVHGSDTDSEENEVHSVHNEVHGSDNDIEENEAHSSYQEKEDNEVHTSNIVEEVNEVHDSSSEADENEVPTSNSLGEENQLHASNCETEKNEVDGSDSKKEECKVLGSESNVEENEVSSSESKKKENDVHGSDFEIEENEEHGSETEIQQNDVRGSMSDNEKIEEIGTGSMSDKNVIIEKNQAAIVEEDVNGQIVENVDEKETDKEDVEEAMEANIVTDISEDQNEMTEISDINLITSTRIDKNLGEEHDIVEDYLNNEEENVVAEVHSPEDIISKDIEDDSNKSTNKGDDEVHSSEDIISKDIEDVSNKETNKDDDEVHSPEDIVSKVIEDDSNKEPDNDDNEEIDETVDKEPNRKHTSNAQYIDENKGSDESENNEEEFEMQGTDVDLQVKITNNISKQEHTDNGNKNVNNDVEEMDSNDQSDTNNFDDKISYKENENPENESINSSDVDDESIDNDQSLKNTSETSPNKNKLAPSVLPFKIRFNKKFKYYQGKLCSLCSKHIDTNANFEAHILSHIQPEKPVIKLYRFSLPNHLKITNENCNKYLKPRTIANAFAMEKMRNLVQKYSPKSAQTFWKETDVDKTMTDLDDTILSQNITIETEDENNTKFNAEKSSQDQNEANDNINIFTQTMEETVSATTDVVETEDEHLQTKESEVQASKSPESSNDNVDPQLEEESNSEEKDNENIFKVVSMSSRHNIGLMNAVFDEIIDDDSINTDSTDIIEGSQSVVALRDDESNYTDIIADDCIMKPCNTSPEKNLEEPSEDEAPKEGNGDGKQNSNEPLDEECESDDSEDMYTDFVNDNTLVSGVKNNDLDDEDSKAEFKLMQDSENSDGSTSNEKMKEDKTQQKEVLKKEASIENDSSENDSEDESPTNKKIGNHKFKHEDESAECSKIKKGVTKKEMKNTGGVELKMEESESSSESDDETEHHGKVDIKLETFKKEEKESSDETEDEDVECDSTTDNSKIEDEEKRNEEKVKSQETNEIKETRHDHESNEKILNPNANDDEAENEMEENKISEDPKKMDEENGNKSKENINSEETDENNKNSQISSTLDVEVEHKNTVNDNTETEKSSDLNNSGNNKKNSDNSSNDVDDSDMVTILTNIENALENFCEIKDTDIVKKVNLQMTNIELMNILSNDVPESPSNKRKRQQSIDCKEESQRKRVRFSTEKSVKSDDNSVCIENIEFDEEDGEK